jgi:ferredoxin
VHIDVDWDLCESNGLCALAAPEVFELQDDDTQLIPQENPDESLNSKVENAVRTCPKRALASSSQYGPGSPNRAAGRARARAAVSESGRLSCEW